MRYTIILNTNANFNETQGAVYGITPALGSPTYIYCFLLLRFLLQLGDHAAVQAYRVVPYIVHIQTRARI